jgi:hypothetical protein
MFSRLLYRIVLFFIRLPKSISYLLLGVLLILPLLTTLVAKMYQQWDNDPDRGAVAMADGRFGENYSTPEYLDQGWDANASLWFYTTTQGSALLPYDFLLALEQPEKSQFSCERNGKNSSWFLCPKFIDDHRYLPQKATFFNPDALPVGFVKERYQGRDYVGLTCSACHTGQVNYQGRALRIDGGPAMADMVALLTDMSQALRQTQRQPDRDNPRLQRFIDQVLALDNDFSTAEQVEAELNKWTHTRDLYNTVNHSTTRQCLQSDGSVQDCAGDTNRPLRYGYARLDAFGRIYNRVLQHAINRSQLEKILKSVTRFGGAERVLTDAEVELVLRGVGDPTDAVLKDEQFAQILANLRSNAPGYPALNQPNMLRIRNAIFNPPNAPVSYPFLWDITRSDYVQWNGLAGNSFLGPLGRNAGEVIGVFAILDWHTETGVSKWMKNFSLSSFLTGQSNKEHVINFKSSVDLFNLERLESHLGSLMSPRWPFCRHSESGAYYLPNGPQSQPVDVRACAGKDLRINPQQAERGKVLYAERCQSCHIVLDREAGDRLMVSNMVGIQDAETTDETMARNSVMYHGKSGNLKNTYQDTDVGTVVIQEDAPVVQILTAGTKGVIATPDADKWLPARLYDWVYSLVRSAQDNPIKNSLKAGNYLPDTTANPYQSLLAYRGRSLNGIWATAPYLHNGSVPTLYDLLSCAQDRPKTFQVGAREFDPIKVGLKSEGYAGFTFDTTLVGNLNKGHDYGACQLSHDDRMALIEYLKTL